MRTQLKGSLSGMLSAACYGTSPSLALALYQLHFDAANALFYRYFGALILITPLLLIKKEKLTLPWADFKMLALPGICFALSTLFYFVSFSYMNAGISATIMFIYPLFTALIMVCAYHEKLSLTMILAIVLSFVGVMLLHDAEAGGLSLIGTLLSAGSALTYALYIVGINRSHLLISNEKLTFYLIVFSAALTAVYIALSPSSSLLLPTLPAHFILIGLLALVPTIISLELMNVSVASIGSTATAILGALEPLTAVALSVLIFHEELTLSLILGIAFILSGVIIVIAGHRFKARRARVYVRHMNFIIRKSVSRHWRWKS